MLSVDAERYLCFVNIFVSTLEVQGLLGRGLRQVTRKAKFVVSGLEIPVQHFKPIGKLKGMQIVKGWKLMD